MHTWGVVSRLSLVFFASIDPRSALHRYCNASPRIAPVYAPRRVESLFKGSRRATRGRDTPGCIIAVFSHSAPPLQLCTW